MARRNQTRSLLLLLPATTILLALPWAAQSHASETTFCDSTQTAFTPYVAAIPCPCGSTQTLLGSGCVNGAGTHATLTNIGTDSVTAADAHLVTTGITPNKLSFSYFGQNVAGGPNPIGLSFHNGIRCINETYRLTLIDSGSGGSIDYKLFQTPLPPGAPSNPFVPGSTWLFQTFYRDNPVAGCSTGDNYQNMSNGWSITFTP